MTTGDLCEQIWEQLENRAAYPVEEVCALGINAALVLLCLQLPRLYTQEITTTLTAELLALDLRAVAPRTIAVRRIVIGQSQSDRPVEATGTWALLHHTTREQLSRLDSRWWTRRGMPRKWYALGTQQLVVTPRPVVDVLATLTCAALPIASDPNALTAELALDAVQHSMVVDTAAALLRIKQGAGEAERGLQHLQTILQGTQMEQALRRLRAMQRDATALQPA